jgi:hypothetical protein
MLISAAFAQDTGLTVRTVLADLPHDPASIVGYLFILLFIGFIVAGTRRGKEPGGPAPGR